MKFLKFFDEKSDIWVKILKITALVELGLFLLAASLLLLAALFDYWNAGEYLTLCFIILIAAAITIVINMVIVNALYNLQEIRKAVTQNERRFFPKNDENM